MLHKCNFSGNYLLFAGHCERKFGGNPLGGPKLLYLTYASK